jgi:aminoglycoside phosphotransferase (APT) family kinase protein
VTTHKGRDLEKTREAFAAWLRATLPGEEPEVSPLVPPGATGFSNDTLFFDLARRRGSAKPTEPLVLRIQPTENQVFPDYDLAKQIRCMRLLEKTDVPVPRVLWHEPDASLLGAPFYVMERVAGRIPPDNPPYHLQGWLAEAPEAEREAVWWSGLDTLADVHRLDWRAAGFGFLDETGGARTPLSLHLAQYRRYLAWAARGRPQPTCESALAWLEANAPADEPTVLSWGDARIGNMIFREGRCVAVLDWEMVTVGSPEADLAWFLFLDRHHSEGVNAPRLPGFPSREATLERYAGRTGHAARHLHYYEVFAAFRFSVIMIRLAQQFQALGLLPPDSTLETDNIPSRLLAKLLELPPPAEVAASVSASR